MTTSNHPTTSTSSTGHLGQRIGYVRVSTVEQNDARQLAGMVFDRTFADKASGKDTVRPQLRAMLDFIRAGDHLYVHSMDRFSRSLNDLENMVKSLTGRGVAITFVKENMTFTGSDSPMNMLMLQLLGAVGQFERSIILERQREGIAVAKGLGVYKGRKPSLDAAGAAKLRRMAVEGVSKVEIATTLGISRASVYEYLKAPA